VYGFANRIFTDWIFTLVDLFAIEAKVAPVAKITAVHRARSW
jgi:hypothetical protein